MNSVATSGSIDCATLRSWMRDRGEIALLDVREHGQYGEGHPFFAVSLPYSRLEIEIDRLVPCRETRIVLLDNGEGISSCAERRLQAMGFHGVHVLAGGVEAWSDAGHTLFAGVNVPSKAFGELVEDAYRTPHISAAELMRMRERGEKVVVVDGRPFSEYRRMNIPGAICCPNGELAYRIRELVDDADTTVVVNCAGRTRSIVGAQTLIESGIGNRVFALENGTQGWYLDDFALEHGSARLYPDDPAPRGRQEARERAKELCSRLGLVSITPETLGSWLGETHRNTYVCDVRSPEEFAEGSLPGARCTPGGQLVQALDQFIAVRHARIVLFDSDGVRAPTTAGWLLRMGHNAFVLEGGLQAGLEAGLKARVSTYSPPPLERVNAEVVARWIESDQALAVDLRSSTSYRSAHLRGSIWGIRPRLAALVGQRIGHRRLVLISDEPKVAAIAAADLREAGFPEPLFLDFGDVRAGIDAESGAGDNATGPSDAERIDFLFFAHDRHEGNKAAARQYLAWETGLLSQLDDDEKSSFFPCR